MKNFIFTLLTFTLGISLTFAQSPGAAKLNYDSGTLDKAKNAIDKAITNEKHAAKWKTWYYRGLIYGRIAEVSGDPTLGKLYGDLDADPATKALEAYNKANELVDKDKDKETIKTGLKDLARQAFSFGVFRYQKEDLEGAYNNFLIADKLNPDYLFALTYAAGMAYELEKMEEYEKLLTKIINTPKAKFDEFNKTLPETSKGEDKSRFWINYVALQYQKAAEQEDENKQKALFKKTYDINKKGLEEFPDNEQLQKNKTTLASQIGNTEEAIKELEGIIASGKATADTYQSLGNLYEDKDVEKAEKYFKKALELDANSINANNSLGVVNFNKGVKINEEINEKFDVYDEQGKADELKKLRAKRDDGFKNAIPYFQKVTEVLAPGTDMEKQIGEERAKKFRIQTLYNLLRCYNVLLEQNKDNAEYKQKKEEITKTLKNLDPEFGD